MPEYVLSAVDEQIVRQTTEGVTAAQLPEIVRIHETGIEKAMMRRVMVVRELESLDRAIAMRRASLRRLMQQFEGPGGGDA
jgi:arsenate reductase-like glutaredoxin family protein